MNYRPKSEERVRHSFASFYFWANHPQSLPRVHLSPVLIICEACFILILCQDWSSRPRYVLIGPRDHFSASLTNVSFPLTHKISSGCCRRLWKPECHGIEDGRAPSARVSSITLWRRDAPWTCSSAHYCYMSKRQTVLVLSLYISET